MMPWVDTSVSSGSPWKILPSSKESIGEAKNAEVKNELGTEQNIMTVDRGRYGVCNCFYLHMLILRVSFWERS